MGKVDAGRLDRRKGRRKVTEDEFWKNMARLRTNHERRMERLARTEALLDEMDARSARLRELTEELRRMP